MVSDQCWVVLLGWKGTTNRRKRGEYYGAIEGSEAARVEALSIASPSLQVESARQQQEKKMLKTGSALNFQVVHKAYPIPQALYYTTSFINVLAANRQPKVKY